MDAKEVQPRKPETAHVARPDSGITMNDAYFRILIEHGTDTVTLTNVEGTIIYVAPSIEQLLGYTPGEFIGRNGQAFLNSADILLADNTLAQLLEHPGKKFTVEMRLRHKDGTWIWVEIVSTNLLDDPRIQAIVSSLRDISRRKHAEQALTLSELRFRTMFEQSPLSTQIFLPNGQTMMVNHAWEELWGTTLEQIGGYNILHDSQLTDAGIMPFIRKGFAGEVVAIPSMRYVPAKTIAGLNTVPYRWVRALIYPIKDQQGLIREVALIHEDITEQKKAEERIQESEQQLQAIIDGSTSIIYLKDLDGRYITINRRYEELFKVDRETITGTTDYDHFPRETADQFRINDRAVLEAGHAIEWEEIVPQDDGVHTYIAVKFPLFDLHGRAYALCGVSTDITERKRVEEELRHSRDQLNIIFQHVADGITVQDRTGQLIYANDAGARFVGFASAEEMLALDRDSLRLVYVNRFTMLDEQGRPIAPQDLPGVLVLRGANYAESLINYIDNRTGNSLWSLVKASAIRDDTGQIQFVVNIFSDMTGRKELEKRKDEFLRVASHELRTPLTSIKGFAQVLDRKLPELSVERARNYLSRINASVNKLSALVDDLLDLSRIQSGRMVMAREPFEIDALVRETVEDIQATTTSHRLFLSGVSGCTVVGDRNRIGQAIANLLTNAIKYSPEADKVDITVTRDESSATVTVHDYGIGIPKVHQERIFERFYRVDDEASGISGLGIGLHIVMEIVSRHGGTMTVQSEEGKGSTFSFTLPLSCTESSAG